MTRPHACFAEEDSEQALAGADGRRAAELLAGAKAETTRAFADACASAVARLLASPEPLAEGVLFDADELKAIADSLARGIATADLMGRTRVRRRAELAAAAETESFAERVPFVWDYTKDACPECGGKVVAACRCPKNDRVCANRHCWRRLEDGSAAILNDPHGEPVRVVPYERFAEDHDPFTVFADPIPSLAPQSALDYFRRLVPTLGAAVTRYGPRLDRHAFTLAVASDQVLLDRVKAAIVRALTEGESGTPDVQGILDAAGVSHRNPQYAEMVTRTNIMDAFVTGSQDEMLEPEMQEAFPVWEYLGIDDTRAGADHRPKFGRYYPAAAPFSAVRGPRVWNCRCCPNPVHRTLWAQLQGAGKRVESDWN